MTDPAKTLLAGVLDRSGSMHRTATDAEGGWNSLVEAQRNQQGELLISLAQFDDRYEPVYDMVPPERTIPWRCYPRGNTALRDAIGCFVTDLGEKLAKLPEGERPGTVIVAIVTDGLENASREWSAVAIKDLIEQQTRDYGWDFVFIGSNQDAILTGTSLGFDPGKSLTYDSGKTEETFAVASSYVTRTRNLGATGQSVAANSFTDAERDEVGTPTP